MNQSFLKLVQKLLTLAGLKRASNSTLQAIFIAEEAGKQMCLVQTVEAIQDQGLKGDRYCDGSGYWRATDACQVTLITERELHSAKKGVGPAQQIALECGSHRRNLVIDGVKTKALQGKQFKIGSAEFVYDKPRPPCGYIDKISGRGTCKALRYNSGVGIRVVKSGRITVGDALEITSS